MLQIDTMIDGKGATRLMVLRDEKAVGFAKLRGLGQPSTWIDALYVDDGYRRQGIATEMLNRCKELSAQRGAGSISLGVKSENKGACELYKKSGFRLSAIYDDDSGYVQMTAFI